METFADLKRLTVTWPDLSAEITNSPLWANRNSTVNVTWMVTTVGAGLFSGASWTDYLYLSRDTVYDASDTLLASEARSGPQGDGGFYTVTKSVTLPSTSGLYLLLRTDGNGTVAESNEANNQAVAPIHINGPDLAMSDFFLLHSLRNSRRFMIQPTLSGCEQSGASLEPAPMLLINACLQTGCPLPRGRGWGFSGGLPAPRAQLLPRVLVR